MVSLGRANPDAAKLTLSVNISGRQFKRPDFVEEVAGILTETGIDPSLVRLELTESVLMDNADEAVATIKRLKALSVKVVIDDFGTGYSSLSYIQRFPFDSLKVDRSFVGNMNEAEQNMEIVRAIIAMAHKLGLEVVAEGVELDEHRTALTDLHCESAQGFYFSRPVPGDELDALIKRGVNGESPSS
ncbi:MAG TPA: EAL domain-containing protein [Solidesulfovibrio sp.]|nr:EAL domain-containing protein [Solidesulfovibrio sp.]